MYLDDLCFILPYATDSSCEGFPNLFCQIPTTWIPAYHLFIFRCSSCVKPQTWLFAMYDWTISLYRQVSNIRRILAGNKFVDHSDVVGASPVGAAPTTSSFST